MPGFLRRNSFPRDVVQSFTERTEHSSYENNVHEKDSMAAKQLIALFPRTILPLVHQSVCVLFIPGARCYRAQSKRQLRPLDARMV